MNDYPALTRLLQMAPPRSATSLARADAALDFLHVSAVLGDLLRVARARYDLNTESRGEQFDGFEQLVPPVDESPKRPVQSAGIAEADDARQAS